MKRIFTFFISVLMVSTVFAQRPEGIFGKASVAPVIDGVIDDVWSEATVYNIDKPYRLEVPTVGEPGETTWQGLWDEDGVYILYKVTDDDWHPGYEVAGSNNWEYDKPEIYFDVNYELEDGKGASANAGHIQIAPGAVEGKDDGTPTTDNQVVYSFKVDGSNWVAEYFIPFSRLIDKGGNQVDIYGVIGFDATLNDRDEGDTGRRRAVWANIGDKDEDWSNMDDAGHVTFGGLTAAVDITSIVISGNQTIDTDNGTVQLSAAVLPLDATQKYKWVITEGEKLASVSPDGLLKATREDGTVKVKAVSVDDFTNSNELTITITNQVVTVSDISFIKNGNFTQGADLKQDWGGKGVVEDGWYNLACTPQTNIWDNMFGQPSLPIADATTEYVLKFKAKGSGDLAVPLLFEDRSHDNNKVVTSSVEYRDNDNGRWNLPVTAEEKEFTIDVVFSAWQADSKYEINFQAGMIDGTFSITDIMMFPKADLELVTNVKEIDANSMNVFPNPVENKLYVDLAGISSKVAIYNALGQKLMEKTSTGSRLTFDVSSLRKGMYFVKLEDGTTKKFVK